MGKDKDVVEGIVSALAELPRDARLDAKALGRILGRCKKSVQRTWRRGELPPPFLMGGKHFWLVGAILEHFRARQEQAALRVRRRDVEDFKMPS